LRRYTRRSSYRENTRTKSNSFKGKRRRAEKELDTPTKGRRGKRMPKSILGATTPMKARHRKRKMKMKRKRKMKKRSSLATKRRVRKRKRRGPIWCAHTSRDATTT